MISRLEFIIEERRGYELSVAVRTITINIAMCFWGYSYHCAEIILGS